MPALHPLLRSPPFPWVDAAVASVSGLGGARPAPALGGDPFELLRRAQVGGEFWQGAAQVRRTLTTLIVSKSPAQAREMIAAAARDPDRTPLLVPVGGRFELLGVEQAGGDVDPWSLLQGDVVVHADADSDLAALAIVAAVPRHIHGDGRFTDEHSVADHLANTAYRDPFTGQPASFAATVELLGEWRRVLLANRRIAVLAGITSWKRRTMTRFFWAPRTHGMRFCNDPQRACDHARAAGGSVVAWPSRVPESLATIAVNDGVELVGVEDGFLRSTGLGSGLHPPSSIVVDRQGLHYDPRQASDLETLLQTHEFTPELIARAQALRAAVVAGGIGKYGASAGGELPARDIRRRLVLVPGQVQGDLSVLRGAGDATNSTLLARARALEPEAEIWYRPHPDVDAGHRLGGMADHEALRHADRVVRAGSIADLLQMIDGIHVLTSLSGFEALLRGCDVTVHGMPFFAGWGLTRDLTEPPSRRTRRLTLDELVAGALILYPRYLDPVTQLPCPPETLVSRLSERQAPRLTPLTLVRAAQGGLLRGWRRRVSAR